MKTKYLYTTPTYFYEALKETEEQLLKKKFGIINSDTLEYIKNTNSTDHLQFKKDVLRLEKITSLDLIKRFFKTYLNIFIILQALSLSLFVAGFFNYICLIVGLIIFMNSLVFIKHSFLFFKINEKKKVKEKNINKIIKTKLILNPLNKSVISGIIIYNQEKKIIKYHYIFLNGFEITDFNDCALNGKQIRISYINNVIIEVKDEKIEKLLKK